MATLDGTAWKLENYKGPAVEITIAEAKQTVRFFKCENTAVTIHGKCTSISVNQCKGFGVIFDSAIASFEVVNSSKLQVQINQTVPSVIIDKTQGCTIYVQSAEGKTGSIVTSNCSEINVITPNPKGVDHDPIEQFIPNQFVSTFDGAGKLITKPTEHVGV